MLTRGNLVFAANYRRAADSRPYGRFPAVCKKDSGIDWWSNKFGTIARRDVGAAISRPPKIIAWPDFSGVFAGVALRAADSRPYGMGSVQLSVNRSALGSVA